MVLYKYNAMQHKNDTTHKRGINMKVYTKEDLMKLENDLGPISISLPNDTCDAYFDGYAMVYDCAMISHNKLDEIYKIAITHEMLCLYLNGEED